MTSGFVDALTGALERPNARDSIDAVHRVMTSGLRELDPQAEIRETGYFNHSWAPDFVVRWPEGNEERHVFLRFSVFHPEFRFELEHLGESPAVFIGLDTTESSRKERFSGAVSDLESAALITET